MASLDQRYSGFYLGDSTRFGALLAEHQPAHKRAAAIVFWCRVALGVCRSVIADFGYVVRQDLAAASALPVTFHGGAR